MKKFKVVISEHFHLDEIKIWLFLSLIISLSVEVLNQGLIGSARFISLRPSAFLVNYGIVAGILSFTFLFKRKAFGYTLLSSGIILFAIANYFVLKFRGSPISFVDLYSIKDAIAISSEYVTKGMWIAVSIGLVLLIGLLVYTYRFKSNTPKKYVLSGILIICLCSILNTQGEKFARSRGYLFDNTWNLKLNSEDNGFLFSFFRSYELSKIDEPLLYEKKILEELADTTQPMQAKEQTNTPNIIIYQMESIMNPFDIAEIELNQDPMENYHYLMENYTSGRLKVPAYGAGTVRTEFEVISGISMEFFAPGEIPYNNIAKRNVIETPAFVLKDQGYTSTFIHNYEGNFYNRNTVYSNLGFDQFISMEYMESIEEKSSFPKDEHLVDKIIETMQTSEAQDLILAVGVEAHGGYLDTYYENKSNIWPVSDFLDMYDLRRVQSYIDKIYSMDQAIKRLYEYVMEQEEDTVLILYSDHLPALASDTIHYQVEDLYETSYVIVDNMGLEKEDEDLKAYQLLAKVFDRIQLYGGHLPAFHQQYKDDTNYLEYLELMQYDLSFGQHYMHEEVNPYTRTEIQYGLQPIEIKSIQVKENQSIISGEAFTFASVVHVNGKAVDTTFIDPNTLKINTNIKEKDQIKIGQLGQNNAMLSYSSEFIYE